MNRSWLAGLLALTALAAVSCGDGPSSTPTTVPTVPPATVAATAPTPVSTAPATPSTWPATFAIGRIPFSTPSKMIAAHQPVLDRLAANLGVSRAVMVTAPSYSGVLQLLMAGTVDVAWLGTTAYVRARLRGALLEPLVCPVRDGRHFYRGEVISRVDSGLAGLAALKGKRVAFVEPSSASGYLFPKALMAQAGVRVPRDLLTREHGEADFLGKHDTVVTAVYLGKFDAGAVYEGAVEQTFVDDGGKMSEIVVLARTGRIFNEPVVVRADMPAATKERIKQAFLDVVITDEVRVPEMGGLEGFVSVTPSDYDVVEEALRTVRGRPRTPAAGPAPVSTSSDPVEGEVLDDESLEP